MTQSLSFFGSWVVSFLEKTPRAFIIFQYSIICVSLHRKMKGPITTETIVFIVGISLFIGGKVDAVNRKRAA